MFTLPFITTYREYITISEREENFSYTEDNTVLRIVGEKVTNYESMYTVEDTDGLLGVINKSVLSRKTSYALGELIGVSRRRFYDKETGEEMFRQYKLRGNEWPDEEFKAGLLGGTKDEVVE